MSDLLQDRLKKMEEESPSPSLVNPLGSSARFIYFDLGEEIDPDRKVELVPQMESHYGTKHDEMGDRIAKLYTREDVHEMYQTVMEFMRAWVDILVDEARDAKSTFNNYLEKVCELSSVSGIPLQRQELDYIVSTYNGALVRRATQEVFTTLDKTWVLAEQGKNYIKLQQGLEKICKIAKACNVQFNHDEIGDRLEEFKKHSEAQRVKVRNAINQAWEHAVKGSSITMGALTYVKANSKMYGVEVDISELNEIIDTYNETRGESSIAIRADFLDNFENPKTIPEQYFDVEVRDPRITELPKFNEELNMGAIVQFYSRMDAHDKPERKETSGSRSFSHSFSQ